jgi:hypothetical protein
VVNLCGSLVGAGEGGGEVAAEEVAEVIDLLLAGPTLLG